MPASPNSRTGRPVSASSAHEIEARRHGSTRRSSSLSPIRDAAPRRAARRRAEALAVARPPDPQRLAAAGVDRDDVARRARRRVQHAVDHQRRRLALQLRRRAEVAAVPTPRDLQVFDVLRVDLIERRVVLRREAAAVDGPLDRAAFLRRRAAEQRRSRRTPHSAAATRVLACCTNSPGLRMRNARSALIQIDGEFLQQRERHDLERPRVRAPQKHARRHALLAAPRASARRTGTSDRRASSPES